MPNGKDLPEITPNGKDLAENIVIVSYSELSSITVS